MTELEKLRQIAEEHLNRLPAFLAEPTRDAAAEFRACLAEAGFTLEEITPAEFGRIYITVWSPSGDYITAPITLS